MKIGMKLIAYISWHLKRFMQILIDQLPKTFLKYHIYLIISKHKFSEEKIDMLKKGKAHLRRNPVQKPKEESKSSDGLVGTAGTGYKE